MDCQGASAMNDWRGSTPLQAFRDWQEGASCDLPAEHREHLAMVRQRPSIRDEVGRIALRLYRSSAEVSWTDSRAPRPVCVYAWQVERAVSVEVLSVQDLSRLELAHNTCIDMMLRYFTRRIELVRMMLGTAALRESWDIERSTIQSARLRLLVERREMLATL